MQVLIVDDEQEIADLVSLYLTNGRLFEKTGRLGTIWI